MKIFGIGFHKTGTSSLKAALQNLGFSVRSGFGVHDPDISQKAWDMARELIPQYDAFEDNPWPLLYKSIDENYDDCKFILTVRDPDSWLRSIVNHFSGNESHMRKWIYGYGDPVGQEDVYLERYLRHNEEVLDYFRGREGRDLLVLRLTEGEGWEKLCPFLNVPRPVGIEFPHRNRSEDREARMRLTSRIRRRLIRARKALVDR